MVPEGRLCLCLKDEELHCTVKLSLTYSDYDDGHGQLGGLQGDK